MLQSLSHVVSVSGLVVAGAVFSLAIYALAKWFRSDDPFAIELIGWWWLTDAVLMTKLRNWTLCFSSPWLVENRDWVLTGLLLCGALLMIFCLGLTTLEKPAVGSPPKSPYLYLDPDASSWRITRWTRAFWARSLASGYASIHLLMFLG